MTFRLITTDCVEAMQSMDEASVDAIVTDPPYGLEFMGKEWDRLGATIEIAAEGADQSHPFRDGSRRVRYGESVTTMQAWHHRWAVEALRVLKPGGHLLAFGGTRTYHRLVCGLEDAGFEIRDCLAWLYGSGFPKSLDVSKAIDRQRDDRPDIHRVTTFVAEARDRAGLTNRDIDAAFGFNGMAGHWTNRTGPQAAVPTWEQWQKLRELCGFGDEMDAEVWRLNGRKGTPGEAWAQREVVGVGTAGLGKGRPAHEGGYRAEYDVTVPATPDAERWQGWGTALKPAFEPIVLARKPLVGTVAQNVLAHGTGALNIDGTRIETNDKTPAPLRRGDSQSWFTTSDPTNLGGNDALGRWPANVVLGHSPDCKPTGKTRTVKGHPGYPNGPQGNQFSVGQDPDGSRTEPWAGHPDAEVEVWDCVPDCPVRLLDEQSGDLKTPASYHRGADVGNRIYGRGMGAKHEGEIANGYGDTGGASRFFYVAKADTVERNRGLYGMSQHHCKVGQWHDAATDTELPRDTVEPTAEDDSDSSMTGSGSNLTDPSPTATKSTTGTGTRKTTGSRTSNSSRQPSTSADTPLTSDQPKLDGSDVVQSAASGSSSTPSTSTSAEKAGSSTGDADPVTSPELLATSDAEERCPNCGEVVPRRVGNLHPT